MKPSDFNFYCWDSVFKNSECESHMWWIIDKMAQNGDEFHEITFEEYKKWGGGDSEKGFQRFVPFLRSEQTICLFGKMYEDKYKELLKQRS